MKTCPYCGKEYVDSLRPEKQLKECPFCQTNFETGLPPKPKFDGGVVAVLLFGLFVFAIPFILCLLATGSLDYMDGTGAAFHIAGLAICLFTIYKYGNRVALYNTALNNPKEYVSQVTAARKEDEEKTQKEIAERKERLARLPACPICGSKEYVERISNTDRSVEVAVWGLGASSVGKQFECRKCLHAFNADSPTPAVVEDPVEELRRYKLLLDEGIITQDEFDEKKKQVLGL